MITYNEMGGARKIMDIREKAKELILKNYALSGNKYIAPDGFHKDQWFWDSCFHSIICSELGLNDLAKNEIERLLSWQKEDGWIPHQIYKKNSPELFHVERWLYKKEHMKFHSSIVQPPMLAQAAASINDQEWTKKVLPKLIKFYLYFAQKRDPDRDGLISVCLPTETGRDTAPDLNFCPGANIIKFFLSLYTLEWRYQKLNWDIEKIWKKDLFNVEDVMFNCIWIDGLRLIGQHELANKAEKAIYELCWDEKDKIFYNLDSRNRKIKRLSVSSFFPLILDNIPKEMSEAIVKRLINPDEFWTPYPVSSAPKNDADFDPSHGFYCNWRGPKWIFGVDYFLVKGLVKHGFMAEAETIVKKDQMLVENEGFCEFYNSLTGEGLRKPTKGFTGSAIVVALPKIIEKTEEIKEIRQITEENK